MNSVDVQENVLPLGTPALNREFNRGTAWNIHRSPPVELYRDKSKYLVLKAFRSSDSVSGRRAGSAALIRAAVLGR